jgi:metal-responsive CopG/Arc/MetJ family transcriptional regulator
MIQRVTVSLPDDVAERLATEQNVSAFVTEAVRDRMARERTAELLAEQGFVITEEGKARARQKLAEAQARMTPERWQELRQVGRKPGA